MRDLDTYCGVVFSQLHWGLPESISFCKTQLLHSSKSISIWNHNSKSIINIITWWSIGWALDHRSMFGCLESGLSGWWGNHIHDHIWTMKESYSFTAQPHKTWICLMYLSCRVSRGCHRHQTALHIDEYHYDWLRLTWWVLNWMSILTIIITWVSKG